MRVKSHWNRQARKQPLEEIAKAAAFISWQIATNGVLNLENQGAQTQSNAHRLHLVGEFLAFLLQVADRRVYQQLTEAQRERFITALALRMATIYADNQRELADTTKQDYRKDFIELLNQRATDYSQFSFEAGFDFLRYFGQQVAALIAEAPWVNQQIAEVEGPQAIQTFTQGLRNLFEGSE